MTIEFSQFHKHQLVSGEHTLKTTFILISKTVKTARESLTFLLFHQTRGPLKDKLILVALGIDECDDTCETEHNSNNLDQFSNTA